MSNQQCQSTKGSKAVKGLSQYQTESCITEIIIGVRPSEIYLFISIAQQVIDEIRLIICQYQLQEIMTCI